MMEKSHHGGFLSQPCGDPRGSDVARVDLRRARTQTSRSYLKTQLTLWRPAVNNVEINADVMRKCCCALSEASAVSVCCSSATVQVLLH